MGQAQFALDRPAEAIESLSKYLRDGQEQVPPARRQDVQAQIALLESLFAELTIATDQSGALITVDGREVGRTPLYQSIRLAAGTHKVSAVMEGMTAMNRTVTLAPGDRQVLNLELLRHLGTRFGEGKMALETTTCRFAGGRFYLT